MFTCIHMNICIYTLCHVSHIYIQNISIHIHNICNIYTIYTYTCIYI